MNRNKRSMTVDLKHPDAPEVVSRLIGSADVLIENFRPGVMERLGIGPQVALAGNPRLIYCRISGYGSSEAHAPWPGQDLLVQCLTGLALLNGRDDDPPVPVGSPVVDASAGELAALVVLAALYERERSGQGQVVGVSLLSTSLWLQGQDVNLYLNTGLEPRRSHSGIANPNFGPPYGLYKAKDGYLAFAHTPLRRLAAVLNAPELATCSTPAEEFEQRDLIYRRLQARISERTVGEWLELLRPAGFWVAPVQTYSECFAQFADEVVCTVPNDPGQPLRMLAPPVTMERTPPAVLRGPPGLGADTAAVAAELGYSEQYIAELIRPGGALGIPDPGLDGSRRSEREDLHEPTPPLPARGLGDQTDHLETE
jgi:crotonobetainyl-CoA:carnitine CoA-transferase CaiB-like acyl-CoA transferase